jgi:hypothetical protein
MLGAVYVKVGPESYFKLAYDLDRLRQLPEFLVIGKFSDPSQVFIHTEHHGKTPQTKTLAGHRVSRA